jgi:hypothetical protein
MEKEQLENIYDEIVDQLKEHLHRGDTTAEAQAMHADFCSQMIGVISQINDFQPFLKDIVIAFADKFQFHNNKLLKKLVLGTSARHLEEIRSAQAVSVASSVEREWKRLVSLDPESAVVVIGLSYRLHAERKIQKLIRLETILEKKQIQR